MSDWNSMTLSLVRQIAVQVLTGNIPGARVDIARLRIIRTMRRSARRYRREHR